MKVFKSIQADCALLGIDSYKQRKKHQLNVKSLITFSMHILTTFSNIYYFCWIDKSFEQNVTSFYVTASILVCFLQFTNLFWEMPKLTDFFLTIGDILRERE